MSDVEEDSDLLEGGLLSEDTASAYSSLRSLMDNLSGY